MQHIFTILLLFRIVLGACNNPKLRKEIRELDNNELQIYLNAVNKLHSTSVPNTNHSYIDQFAKIHDDYNDFPHGKPPFLVWHRQLVRLYEMELQKMDSRVVLPYWDWTLDSQAPERSPILTSKYIGGNGNSNENNCITEGPFRNWELNIPNKHCLKRQFNLGKSISPFATPEEIHLYMNEPNYSNLSLLLEEKHAYIHNFVSGDVRSIHSPNDPLFFLLHTFVDMIFYNWQQRHPNAIYEGSRFHKSVSPDDNLPPFNIRARDTWDITHPIYCYTCSSYPRPIFSDVSQRDQEDRLRTLKSNNPILFGPLYNATTTQAIKLLPSLLNRLPSPSTTPSNPYHSTILTPNQFTDETLIMIKLNITEFRINTAQSDKLRELLNHYPNYVSLSHIGTLVNH